MQSYSNFKLLAVVLLTDNTCKLKRNQGTCLYLYGWSGFGLKITNKTYLWLSVQYPPITFGPLVAHISFFFLMSLNDGKNERKGKYSLD